MLLSIAFIYIKAATDDSHMAPLPVEVPDAGEAVPAANPTDMIAEKVTVPVDTDSEAIPLLNRIKIVRKKVILA